MIARKYLIVSLLVVGAVGAGRVSGQDLVLGPGGSTCGSVTTSISAYGQRQQAIYQSWAQGYLSALNVGDLDFSDAAVEVELHDLGDWAAHWQWLEGFCRENPETSFVAALVALWNGLPRVGIDALASADPDDGAAN